MDRKCVVRSLLALFAFSVAIGVMISLSCAEEQEEPKFEASDYQAVMHSKAQRHRLANGLHVQALDPNCCAIAQRWADHMARTNTFYHGGGEQVIAWGTTAEGAVQMWINSRPHNAWLLSSTSLAGWGAAQSANGTWKYAGVFRNKVEPVTDKEEPSGGGSYQGGRRRFALLPRNR